jgi:hypothetical protein
MALRRHSRDRLARLGRNNAWTFKLPRMCGGRDSRMAVIVVERKRRVFRRCLHVLRLRGRRRDVTLVCGGKLLRSRPRCRAASAAIVADIGGVINNDGLVVDVGDRNVRNVVH